MIQKNHKAILEETFNFKLIESLTATTQEDDNHYLPYMTDNAQTKSVTINDTSDGIIIVRPRIVDKAPKISKRLFMFIKGTTFLSFQ